MSDWVSLLRRAAFILYLRLTRKRRARRIIRLEIAVGFREPELPPTWGNLQYEARRHGASANYAQLLSTMDQMARSAAAWQPSSQVSVAAQQAALAQRGLPAVVTATTHRGIYVREQELAEDFLL